MSTEVERTVESDGSILLQAVRDGKVSLDGMAIVQQDGHVFCSLACSELSSLEDVKRVAEIATRLAQAIEREGGK